MILKRESLAGYHCKP